MISECQYIIERSNIYRTQHALAARIYGDEKLCLPKKTTLNKQLNSYFNRKP